MTKAYLKFPAKQISYLPKVQSRRMGLNPSNHFAAYRTDGEGGGGGEGGSDDEAALLERIRTNIAGEIDKRGFAKADEVAKNITEQLKGLNIEALRAFDPSKLKDDMLKLAGEVEKIRQLPTQGGEQLNALRSWLAEDDNMKLLQRAFNKNSRETVEINMRALVNPMTTQNVVDDGDLPDDILNSFSVTAFVKKRRAQEWIFDLADRTTVQEITEYKTWLEEGTEDGAFAIVAEGAVKPLVSKTLVRNSTKYSKIAGKRVYTEEFAKFRREAYRIIEQLFNDQLVRNYAAILVARLDTYAASYVGTTLDDQFTNPTDFHAIGAVAAQLESLEFNPDVLIINPQDKWRIGLDQTQDGAFRVQIPMVANGGGVQMLGFRVVTSNRIAPGTAYLGEAGLYKIEDEPVTVRLGYGINVDKNAEGVVTDVTSDVDTNRFRIIAETYFHSYIATAHIGSFVKFNFATVKAALLKP